MFFSSMADGVDDAGDAVQRQQKKEVVRETKRVNVLGWDYTIKICTRKRVLFLHSAHAQAPWKGDDK